MTKQMANKGAAGNSRCPFQFWMNFGILKVIGSGASRLPAAVPELTSEVIRQGFFRIFSRGF